MKKQLKNWVYLFVEEKRQRGDYTLQGENTEAVTLRRIRNLCLPFYPGLHRINVLSLEVRHVESRGQEDAAHTELNPSEGYFFLFWIFFKEQKEYEHTLWFSNSTFSYKLQEKLVHVHQDEIPDC